MRSKRITSWNHSSQQLKMAGPGRNLNKLRLGHGTPPLLMSDHDRAAPLGGYRLVSRESN